MKQSLLLAVALAAHLASASPGETCEELLTPRLCGTDPFYHEQLDCSSGTIDFPQMEPCCRLHKEEARKCDDPDATASCRTLEVGPAVCPGERDQDCCLQKNVDIKLHFKWEFSTEECCSNCRCYGDPHCESFAGEPDTWVICDARQPKANDKSLCPMSQAVCEAQLDHQGNPCTFREDYDKKRDSIALNGSPCRFTLSEVPPQMSMYKGEGFDVILNMGERAIIEDVIIQDGTNQYVLNAQLCFDFAFSDRETIPWRDNYGPTGVVPESPDWLPKKWLWSPLDSKDIVWEVAELDSRLDMTIRCTRTPEKVAGVFKYGPPRLNVDIVEPLNWQDADQRPGITGFCPEGAITKLGSTRVTDLIDAEGACTGDLPELDIAKALCGAGTTVAGIPDCKLRFCKKNLPVGNAVQEQQQCLDDITTWGWNREFCALNVFNARTCAGEPGCSRTGKDCESDGACRECLNFIKDDGWKAAITAYGGGFEDGDNTNCIPRAQLPDDLVGLCQKGVTVQYQTPAGNWVTKFAIPADKCVVTDDGLGLNMLTISKTSDPELMYNPIRITQCGGDASQCLTTKCETEVGFKASLETLVERNEVQQVNDQFIAGNLICDPVRFDSTTECLGFTPDPMCPCPT